MNEYQEIIINHGDLERERWGFSILDISQLYLDQFIFETRPSKRHRNWIPQNRWYRHSLRNSTIKDAPMPPADIVQQVKERYKERYIEAIKNLEVRY